MAAVEALVEIFSWIGFGVGALLASIALVVYIADGTWLPVRAVVERLEQGAVVRWFDENGDVNEAPLPEHHEPELRGKDMADVFYRRGWRNRMRFTRRSPAVRGTALFAAGFVGLGVIALVVSWAMLFAQR